MSSDWGSIGNIETKTYTKSGSASDTVSQVMGDLYEEPDYESLPPEEVVSDGSSVAADIVATDSSNSTTEETKDENSEEEAKTIMDYIGDVIGMDYKGREREATIWSSFYGGSAKHTKDHLGRLVNNIFPKTLILDPHNREVAYEMEGDKVKRVYEKGIWKDPDNPKNVKKSKAASIRDTVQGWINNSKLNSLIGNEGTWKKGVEYFSKGTPGVDADGNPKIVKDGLDQKIAKSKFGNFINEYNKKHGFDDTKFGSANQYRVGQNWSYGSLALYSKSWKTDRVSVLGASGELVGEYGYISGGAHLLTAKASANFEIGRDHVELSASAEASLVHLEGAAGAAVTASQLLPEEGFEWVPDDFVVAGGNVSGSADLCKVYAKGKIGAGYYKGADGKMHLDAGIQGSIGADLCSATGTADVTVLGVNASVTGTVKIGVGAQANLGFEDGKLNVHLGVALGVGVEIGFSVDVSGAVEAGAEVLSDIYEGGKEFLSDAWDFVTSW